MLQDYVHLITASVDFCCRLCSHDLLQVLALISAASYVPDKRHVLLRKWQSFFKLLFCFVAFDNFGDYLDA